MIYDVEMLNVIKFMGSDGIEKTRISYRLLHKDNCQESPKFKGYADLSVYVDNTMPFSIPLEYFGKHVKFMFKDVSNPNNPTKKRTKLVKIMSDNDKDICLVE